MEYDEQGICMNFLGSYKFYSSCCYWHDTHSRVGAEVEEGRQYAIINFILTDLTMASCPYYTSAILPHDCFYSNHYSI